MTTGIPRVNVRGRIEQGVATLAVSGEVDLASAQVVRAAVREALDDGVRAVHLDLTAVSLLDSTGLNVLLHCARDAQKGGVKFSSSAPRGSAAQTVIDFSGLGELLGAVPSSET